jgi:hypothetical protein
MVSRTVVVGSDVARVGVVVLRRIVVRIEGKRTVVVGVMTGGIERVPTVVTTDLVDTVRVDVVLADVVVVRLVDVNRVDVVDRVGVVIRVEVVGPTTGPPGPARYQFEGGSPRHSPTVTARYPLENNEVSM